MNPIPSWKSLCTFAILVCAFNADCRALEIGWMSGNGEITWNDTETNGHYSVQWSSALNTNWSSDWSGLTTIAATGGSMKSSIPMFFRIVHFSLQSPATDMLLVQGGGQPGGPSYSFYASRYEVSELQFTVFLNDAQKYSNTDRGTNMFFDNRGSVFMNDDANPLEILFDISSSRLIYNRMSPVGFRYLSPEETADHPITGVSWFGALKYCNWLTIAEGRGASQRCFHEGLHSNDWYPSNLTQPDWDDGFGQLERQNWVDNFHGFRIPMDSGTNDASTFNEFYKMAAWNGLSNTLYGFGRSKLTPHDANYVNSLDPFETNAIQTTPIGYYNGTDHDGLFYTRSNLNFYGICDLSGNVREWAVDRSGYYGDYRSVRGGSWGGYWYEDASTLINTNRTDLYPATVDSRTGFRILNTSP